MNSRSTFTCMTWSLHYVLLLWKLWSQLEGVSPTISVALIQSAREVTTPDPAQGSLTLCTLVSLCGSERRWRLEREEVREVQWWRDVVSVYLSRNKERATWGTYTENQDPIYRTVKRIQYTWHVFFTIYGTSFFKEAVVFKPWHFLCRLNSRSIPQWEQNTAACISYNEYDLHLSRMSDFQTAGYK